MRTIIPWLAMAACCGLAVGYGSLWWLALIVVFAVVLRVKPGLSGVLFGLIVSAGVGAFTYENSLAAAINSLLWFLGAVAIAIGFHTWLHARHLERLELERGWQLAEALSAEQSTAVREALLRDRMSLAGEIHDRIGHRLGHAILRLGTMWQEAAPGTKEAAQLQALRTDLADLLDEIGGLVLLLDDGQSIPPTQVSIGNILEHARRAGTEIQAELEGIDQLDSTGRTVLARVVAEGVANAAKHAPGQAVSLGTSATGTDLVVNISNRVLDREQVGTGSGLKRVRALVSELGGQCDAAEEGGRFVVQARIPLAQKGIKQ
ncbi:hypothetical protein WG936_08395 [Corynebacterium sp. H127]|uniref:sensor histidine kinase n=1 Tax=Corynebacterium sp. H127 TaxID=3133418 RepID=UPI0030980514